MIGDEQGHPQEGGSADQRISHALHDEAGRTNPQTTPPRSPAHIILDWVDAEPEQHRPRAEFLRRHRIHLGMTAALLLIMLLGTAALSAGAFGLRQERQAQKSTSNAHGISAITTPSSAASGVTSITAEGLHLPVGIPGHFSFGLVNAQGDVSLMNEMRTNTGTAWDFRYQYLTGGVNTGKDWETWNHLSRGAFATNYLNESARNGYIPTLIYYELLQSNGACNDCGESQRDLSNLNNPSLMLLYYANWRLLMQKIGGYGRPALVIVEPDLWGFMEQAVIGAGNVASTLPASAASSGDTDAQGYPNTAQGFAWALLHIRDRYAPNAVLALHTSDWATAQDIGSSTDPNLNVNSIATSTAQFLLSAGLQGNPSGVSTWDLLSNDVADQDSGQGSAWWDRKNLVYPNFARYLTFIHLLTQDTKRSVIMWQVPEGNQYFDTENNSSHHTQDNRAEYILGHVADFARAGIIGVLFGPGNGGTSVDDAAHDGVTNPAPITGFECNNCNNHISTYPDDDGGYLRLFVGAYYRHGPLQLANPTTWKPAPAPGAQATALPLPQGACVGLPIATIGTTTATPNPVNVGETVTFSVTVTLSCATPVLVDVEANSTAKRIIQVTQDNVGFQPGQMRMVHLQATVPPESATGSYLIRVGVFHIGWGAIYGWKDSAATLIVK